MIDNMNLEQKMRIMVDRGEISDVIFRYFSGVDQRDWGRWGSCLTEDVEIDLGFGQKEIGRQNAIQWAETGLAGIDATHHMSSNHEISINGDTATVRSNLLTTHVTKREGKEDRLTAGVVYNYVFIRTREGWRIRKAEVSIIWHDGDPTGPAAVAHIRANQEEKGR